MSWKPRNFLALLVAGMGCWLERQAAAQIEYLKAENRLLRSRLRRRRIVFTDAERSTLATLAKEKEQRHFEASIPSFLLLRYCAGIGNWSQGNGRFWNAGSLADLARRLTLNISSCGSLLRIQAGVTHEFTGR